MGIVSYIGAGLQEQVSGWLIERGSRMVDGAMVYDFSIPRMFWVGMAVVSMLLAASLWKVKAED
jgi:OPA family sugar phosphate sensor protein UhpC-like MFS transporter